MIEANNTPTETKVLIVGGGPAGSYAAAALRREGIEVTLFEAAQFPRYHIGESLLPSINTFLRFIGAYEKVAEHGFRYKPGGAVKLSQHKKEAYTDFVALDPRNGSWNVVRSEFDDILLRHCESLGAQVFENTRVTEILFNESRRPVTAKFKNSVTGSQGSIDFDFIVDCSGRTGIMSTKYQKDRKMNVSLQNAAMWSYWRGCDIYAPGTKRENAPFFEALLDETGWVWFIPLHDGTVSVGVVMKQDKFNEAKSACESLEDHYLKQVGLAPFVRKLINGGYMDTEKTKPAIQQASNYSYQADSYAAAGYRIAGDAGCFIDPFFSSGVHLALVGGLCAAASISAVIRGDVTEELACKFHTKKVGSSYTRFLLVVMGVYHQITKQKQNIMSDIGEDNFDNAFDKIRPVIQGAVESDVKKQVTEKELRSTMDFVKNLFIINPEMEDQVRSRYQMSDLFEADGPVMTPTQIQNLTLGDTEQDVLLELNARKAVHDMYNPVDNFSKEVIAGSRVRMEVNRLTIIPMCSEAT